MIYPRITITLATVIAVAACSPSGNPHLDMCRKITTNILASNVEFGENKETTDNRFMRMVLPYTSDGVGSETLCIFEAEGADDKDSSNSSFRTSPREVIIDGVKIGSKDLMRAALSSSKAVLKDTADETTKQATAAANNAKDKATEMAGEAKDKATELADEAKVKASEVATQIKDSEAVERAKQLAGETTDKAKSAIIEGAKAVQEKLEN